jgi:ATP-binding cassette subfamily F protein uup
MALISLKDISVAFGGPLLLDKINLQIERGERVCLLGRNGAGKSTLMRIIRGDMLPDEGEIVRHQGVRVALLEQEVPEGLTGRTFDVIAGGLAHLHKEGDESGGETGPADDADDRLRWRTEQQVDQIISRMKLDPDSDFASLSAGLKRRVLLARGLAHDPDILLLDEPTNHLDIEAISQLEDFLLRYGGTLLFITHDRMFLRRLATRIIELDRGNLIDWSCDYDTFLKRKEALLEAEAEKWAQFDKKLAQEETWIRKGIKARRTRNEGRVRELVKLREARRERRERTGAVRMQVQEAERSGKLVIEAKDISFAYDGQTVFRDFSTIVMRGDKIGIIGPNGSGKTTLLRALLGELPLQKGNLRHGANFEVAYFDQLRAQLDEEKSVQDNVADGNDTVIINGHRRHIIGYLRDFLFSPERARSPVRVLSGGERNRLLLAKLFTKPANVLVMDEPTNDLDAETLELLEELLLDYSGTLLLVSHDRAFLNNVVTSTLVIEEEGQVLEYIGGYDDWLRQRPSEPVPTKPEKTASPKGEKVRSKQEKPRKLTFKEQKELETLPERIENLETEQQELYRMMGDPAFYHQSPEAIIEAKARLTSLEQELRKAYDRWEGLEALNERCA